MSRTGWTRRTLFARAFAVFLLMGGLQPIVAHSDELPIPIQELREAMNFEGDAMFERRMREMEIIMARQRADILDRNADRRSIDQILQEFEERAREELITSQELFDAMYERHGAEPPIQERVEILERYIEEQQATEAEEAGEGETPNPFRTLSEEDAVVGAWLHGTEIVAGGDRTVHDRLGLGGTLSQWVMFETLDRSLGIGGGFMTNTTGYDGFVALGGHLQAGGSLDLGVNLFMLADDSADEPSVETSGDDSSIHLRALYYGFGGSLNYGLSRSAAQRIRIAIPVQRLFSSAYIRELLEIYYVHTRRSTQSLNLNLWRYPVHERLDAGLNLRWQVRDENDFDLRSGAAAGDISYIAIDEASWHLRLNGGASYASDLTNRNYTGFTGGLDLRFGPSTQVQSPSLMLAVARNHYPAFYQLPHPDEVIVTVRFGTFP